MIGNSDLQPVIEFDTSYDLGQLLRPIEPAPTFLSSFDQLEDERQRRLARQAALGANGAMAHGGKCAFNRVRRSQVLSVLSRKVVEGEQRLAVLGQAFGSLLVLQCVSFDEGIEGNLRVGLGLGHPDLVQ